MKKRRRIIRARPSEREKKKSPVTASARSCQSARVKNREKRNVRVRERKREDNKNKNNISRGNNSSSSSNNKRNEPAKASGKEQLCTNTWIETSIRNTKRYDHSRPLVVRARRIENKVNNNKHSSSSSRKCQCEPDFEVVVISPGRKRAEFGNKCSARKKLAARREEEKIK